MLKLMRCCPVALLFYYCYIISSRFILEYCTGIAVFNVPKHHIFCAAKYHTSTIPWPLVIVYRGLENAMEIITQCVSLSKGFHTKYQTS